MVKIYQTERGYFYKEYKNGKKVRISKKSAFKNMKGGYKNEEINQLAQMSSVIQNFSIKQIFKLI